MIVEYEDHGRTVVIRLNRPEARNAVNQELAEALETAIEQENSRPLPDDVAIVDLKKQKLRIKDELASLSS